MSPALSIICVSRLTDISLHSDFIGWPAEPELVSPAESQLQVLAEVERVKRFGGCLSCKVAA